MGNGPSGPPRMAPSGRAEAEASRAWAANAAGGGAAGAPDRRRRRAAPAARAEGHRCNRRGGGRRPDAAPPPAPLTTRVAPKPARSDACADPTPARILATVDEADHEAPDIEFERSRHAPEREVTAPEAFHDRRPPLENLASSVGNRGFGQMVGRMRDGEGILPGGAVHPDVEATIAAQRGGGAGLGRRVATRWLRRPRRLARRRARAHRATARRARPRGLGARVHRGTRHLLRAGRVPARHDGRRRADRARGRARRAAARRAGAGR